MLLLFDMIYQQHDIIKIYNSYIENNYLFLLDVGFPFRIFVLPHKSVREVFAILLNLKEFLILLSYIHINFFATDWAHFC